MSEVKYATGYKAFVREVPRGPFGIFPGQGKNGYGSKISTDYMVSFPGDRPARTYRVFTSQFSNVASLYIIRGGVKLYIRESELISLVKAG